MIAHPGFIRRTARPAPAGADYVLQVIIEGTDPAVTRRIVVPANARLDWVHAVLQLVVGWTNSHLHLFRSGDRIISSPDFGLADESVSDDPVLDENKTQIREVLPGIGDTLHYEYDFGDCWQHTITVEEVRTGPKPARRRAECLAAERACPPEDCGGASGYAHLLKALADRRHPDHATLKRWIGRPFKPNAFDLPRVSAFLSLLPWPHPSEARLRRLLMARDGV